MNGEVKMVEKIYGKLYNVFVNQDTPFGVKPVGNPVVACICGEFPTEEIMKSISIDFGVPIICFLKCSDIENRTVDIRYYCGYGKEVNLCGHGTFGSTKFISEHFNLHEGDSIKYIPHCEKYRYLISQTIYGTIEKVGCSIVFPKLEKKVLDDQSVIESVCKVLGISCDSIKNAYWSSLDDIILILNDAEEMRRINPNYSDMLELAIEFNKSDLRAIMTSVISDQDGYDFETRVFAPWIDADEDVACGSANCSLAHYWSDYFGKSEMKMIYPYTVQQNRTVGGVQIIEILDENLVKISSDAYLRRVYEIEYDRDCSKYVINEIEEEV